MRRSIFAIFILTAALSIPDSGGQTSPSTDSSAAPLRVAVAGMAHGHTNGFLQRVKNRHDVEIIGVAEPDRKLFDRYAADFHLDASLYHADLDEMGLFLKSLPTPLVFDHMACPNVNEGVGGRLRAATTVAA